MAANLNKVMLIGNVGKDADLRYSSNGLATATFSLAVNNRRKRDDGEWEDQTEWFACVLFAEQAERVAQYILKGKPLYVEGRLQTRSWDDDQGVKRYRTEVIASTIQLLGSRDDQRQGPPVDDYDPSIAPRSNLQRTHGRPAAGAAPIDDIDDLPFE